MSHLKDTSLQNAAVSQWHDVHHMRSDQTCSFKYAKYFHVPYIYIVSLNINTQDTLYVLASIPFYGCLWKWFLYFHVFLLLTRPSLCMTAPNPIWECLLVVFREYCGCCGSWATLSPDCEWASSLWEEVIKQTRIHETSSLAIIPHGSQNRNVNLPINDFYVCDVLMHSLLKYSNI